MTTEQDEINASYDQLIKLEMQNNCPICNLTTNPGVSFCNAKCENMFNNTGVQFHLEDTLINLDKSEIELHISKNKKKLGWAYKILEITSFESPFTHENTGLKIKEFLATIKFMIVDEVATNMFYKCYVSQGFAEATIYIKVYFGEEKSMIELRHIHGCSDLFIQIYRSCKNAILNENAPLHTNRPFGMDTYEDDDDASNSGSLIRWMKLNPDNGIKVVSHVAMEKDERTQIVMCNEVFSVIYSHPTLFMIAPQTIGFIDMLKTNPNFKLGQDYRDFIIPQLKRKLSTCMDKIKNPSVQLRIQEI